MILGLVLALALTGFVLVYGLFAWERIVRRRREQEPGSSWGATARARAARPDTDLDGPRPFARDAVWLAVRSDDAQAVARELALRTVLPANWAGGLAEVAELGTFVAPPVRGWVLVTGADLRRHSDPDHDLLPLLERLGQRFGAACWFASDSARDVHGWALVREGVVERAYAYTAEGGHVLWHGEPTAAETALGCFVDDPRDQSDDDVKWWPDRRVVHAIAQAWAIDPDRLDATAAPAGVGCVGRW